MTDNILLMTDSYKLTHWKQYPPKTERVYSYFESRGGHYPHTVFFGLQYFLKRYLQGPVVTAVRIDQAEKFVAAHLGDKTLFNRAGWEHILHTYGGKLPVTIKAVPEGTKVPLHNVLMTIENNDDEVAFISNFLETLLVQTWYPTTVATLSYDMRQTILRYLEETGDPNLIDFKLHDFGFRGVSSPESAGIGGAAHLLNFKGTDTTWALMCADEYYHEPMAGFSIPAAEHSTITSWGRENETEAYRNMLNQFPGMVAVVSDSYDVLNACKNIWGDTLKTEVLAHGGPLVVRPDSGYPPKIVHQVVSALGERFGWTRNAKGYRVLNPQVRVIQGDGVDRDMSAKCLEELKKYDWSADNLGFGMGGALLQKLDRDTLKFAFKCASVTVDGQEREVYKDPVTDPGKASKKGRMKLVQRDGTYVTVGVNEPGDDVLQTVFCDGELTKDYTFAECRERAAA